MTVFFITRFSIPDLLKKHFQISKQLDGKDYKEFLFSKERLDKKMIYFEYLCFSSITSQTNKNWKWFIFVSYELPEEYLIFLEKLIKPYHNKIFIHFVSDMIDFKETLSNILNNEKKPYISSRIDDDDGISDSFVEKILHYLPMDKHIINFVHGRVSFYNEFTKDIDFGNLITYFNNSVGLSIVNHNIFDLGNHVKIHEKNNIIYNNQKNMFFLTHDEKWCDTKRPLRKN